MKEFYSTLAQMFYNKGLPMKCVFSRIKNYKKYFGN